MGEKEETVAVKYGVGKRRDSKRSGCDKYGVGGGGRRRRSWVENWEGREIGTRGA